MPKPKRIALLTPAQAKERMEKRGETVVAFARQHSLDPPTVYQVLSGQKKGRRGEAHRAAVLLGIKDGVVLEAKE